MERNLNGEGGWPSDYEDFTQALAAALDLTITTSIPTSLSSTGHIMRRVARLWSQHSPQPDVSTPGWVPKRSTRRREILTPRALSRTQSTVGEHVDVLFQPHRLTELLSYRPRDRRRAWRGASFSSSAKLPSSSDSSAADSYWPFRRRRKPPDNTRLR